MLCCSGKVLPNGGGLLLRVPVISLLLLAPVPALAWKPAPPPPSLEVLLSRAQTGDVPASRDIGFRYLLGQGVPQDASEALRWLLRAADKQDSQAKWGAGEIIFRGLTGKEDRNKGLALIRAAAEADNVDAFYAMGDRYFQSGLYREAAPWFEKVASRGYGFAYRKLALMYLRGDGVDQSDKVAAHNFCLAAYRGDASALAFLAGMYATGRGVEKSNRLSGLLWNEAVNRGVDFTKTAFGNSVPLTASDSEILERVVQAVKKGDLDASYSLGLAYRFGRAVARSDALAVKFLTEPAKAGNADAQFHLAEVLASDHSYFRNRDRVRELLRSAAEQGHLRAMVQLGIDLYLQAGSASYGAANAEFFKREFESLREQGRRDAAEALSWLIRAGQGGSARAYSSLASFYGHGPAGAPRAIPLDIKLRAKYLKLAAEQGEVWSQFSTGMNFLSGTGFEKDVVEAKRWFAMAARQQAVFGHYPVTQARQKMKEIDGNIDDREWSRADA